MRFPIPEVILNILHFLSISVPYQTLPYSKLSAFNNPSLGSHFGQIGIPATYDYIVVGGGTAGLAIAHRLAKDHTVAVIEAGSLHSIDNSNLTDIPSGGAYYVGKSPLFQNPLIDWGQITTPQEGFGGVEVLYSSGKVLGGSSARNFMAYHRGSKGTHMKWAEETGDSSYEWDNFLPFFKKSVQLHEPKRSVREGDYFPQYNVDDFDPEGGPLKVSYPVFPNPATAWFSKGLEAIGIKALKGLNDGDLFGWSYNIQTVDPDTQTRSSSATFLKESILRNDGLVVYPSTLGKKIIFDEDKQAKGVVVETGAIGSGSVTYELHAKEEVIISAGAFRSPQMLMVSGIGPRSILEEMGITIVAERPGVGQGMWDHVFWALSYEVNILTHSWLGNINYRREAAQEYIEKNRGILTNVGTDVLSFERFPPGFISPETREDIDSTFGPDWPDIEHIYFDTFLGSNDDFLFSAINNQNNYSAIISALAAPFSRGNVSIASADTKDRPIVNPNWLSDPRDQEIAIAGLRRARLVLETKEMKELMKQDEESPGLHVQSDEDILAFIKRSSSTVFHAACSCKMGKADDPMAVLDSRARVIGVKGLRVVDASALPVLPPGHPQATIYALAEKIAHDILSSETTKFIRDKDEL